MPWPPFGGIAPFSFLTLALDGDEWLLSGLGHSAHRRKIHLVHVGKEMRNPVRPVRV